MSLNTYCAICWNGLFPDITTIAISGLFCSLYSKNVVSETQSAGNQRRSHFFIQKKTRSSLVGTSETTRTGTIYSQNFCQWLAGLIDGDGCLLVSKQGYTSLEITVGLEDLPLLRLIQNKIGGSVKIRSGAKAWRYRLHNKEGMKILIGCINGYIQHSSRLAQLHRVCQQLNISVVDPTIMTSSSAWFSGFFDADGTIGISIKNSYPQLSVRVANKLFQDVEWYKKVFGGNTYFDSSQNGYYHWSIQSKEDILKLHKFFAKHCRSHKSQRFFLVEEYYSLVSLQAYKPDSHYHKAWQAFIKKWNK